MSRHSTILPLVAGSLILISPASAQQRAAAPPPPPPESAAAYLKLGEIEGESLPSGSTEPEDSWIELTSVQWTSASSHGEFWFEHLAPGLHEQEDGPGRAAELEVRVNRIEMGVAAPDGDPDDDGDMVETTDESDHRVIVREVRKRDGAGLPTGKRQHKPFTMTKEMDKASPRMHEHGDSEVAHERVEVMVHRELPTGTPLVIVAGSFAQCEPGARYPSLAIRDGDTAHRLENVTVEACMKSWSTSGDADDRPTEEVAFYYNKIAFSYRAREHVLLGRQIP